MSPARRYRVIEALIEIIPMPDRDCARCDPQGGCPNDVACRRELAETILEVVERESL